MSKKGGFNINDLKQIVIEAENLIKLSNAFNETIDELLFRLFGVFN